jgi:hypothetical protein
MFARVFSLILVHPLDLMIDIIAVTIYEARIGQ